MGGNSRSVEVYVYDLSKGFAKQFPLGSLFGAQFDGIWHTGISVYGEEYYYGDHGIASCRPATTPELGQPNTIIKLGDTNISKQDFTNYLKELAKTSFKPESYDLLEHNCNSFSSAVAQYLTGRNIPEYILKVQSEILSSPLGQTIRPLIENLRVTSGQNTKVYSE